MLTSISPLGERARGHRWGVTMGWLAAGHVVGGLALGVLLAGGAVGVDAVFGGDHGHPVRVVVVVGAAVSAAAFDLLGGRLPGRRQVDETWLGSFRGWVYGLGFGAQLGFGLVTVVNTALMGVLVVGALLAGPAGALLVGVAHGVTRAVLATLNARVRTVDDLKSLHRRLDGAARAVGVAAPAALLALVAAVGTVTVA